MGSYLTSVAEINSLLRIMDTPGGTLPLVAMLHRAYQSGRREERRRRAASCQRRYHANRGRCACGKAPCPFLSGRYVC